MKSMILLEMKCPHMLVHIFFTQKNTREETTDVSTCQVTFIYIALLTIQIVSKQLYNIKTGK